MALSDVIKNIQVLVIILTSGIVQVISEYCGNNINCYFPEKCCNNGLSTGTCCYDNDRDDRLFTYKLHVWNMWYFWFIIIFIMMSCFGGCGYYRRKRMAAISRIQQRQRTVIPPATDYMNRTRHSSTNVHPNFMVYTGPGLDTESTYLPPPYSEVVSQPGMYPPNKSDLPPYPGAPVITADNSDPSNSSVTLNVQDLNSQPIPQPPSYNEVLAQSNQTSVNSNTGNQNSSTQSNQSQTAASSTNQSG